MRQRPDTDMARMLAVLNGGEVARRLKVTRTAVSEWSYSPDPPPVRVVQVRELLLEALGETKEAPTPQWATGLMQKVDAIAKKLGVSLVAEAERSADVAVDEALEQPPAGGVPGDPRPRARHAKR